MALTTFLHHSNAKHPPVPTPEPTPSAAAPVQLRPLRRSCQDRLVTARKNGETAEFLEIFG